AHAASGACRSASAHGHAHGRRRGGRGPALSVRSATSRPLCPFARLEAIGCGARGQRVEGKAVLERWKGAAAAIGSVTKPARKANPDPGAFEVESVGVALRLSVRGAAPQGDDITRRRLAPTGGPAHDGAREAEVSRAGGQFGDLHLNAARQGERSVHAPARTRAAIAHERKARRGET